MRSGKRNDGDCDTALADGAILWRLRRLATEVCDPVAPFLAAGGAGRSVLDVADRLGKVASRERNQSILARGDWDGYSTGGFEPTDGAQCCDADSGKDAQAARDRAKSRPLQALEWPVSAFPR